MQILYQLSILEAFRTVSQSIEISPKRVSVISDTCCALDSRPRSQMAEDRSPLSSSGTSISAPIGLGLGGIGRTCETASEGRTLGSLLANLDI